MPADLDLARRLAAHPRFVWADGVRALILFRDHPCTSVTDERMPVRAGRDGLPLWQYTWMGIPDHDPLPDLADAATAGVVLASLPVQWEAGPSAGSAGFVVRLFTGRFPDAYTGATLGEAAARAWLAAQEVQP